MPRVAAPLLLVCACVLPPLRAANPIITDVLTADPAAMVSKGTVYIYTGHDEAPDRTVGYRMNNWLCFSSTDMAHWTARPSPLSVKDFAWASKDAWAGQVIEHNDKFYWFVPMSHATIHGFAIGVAVADSPTGPFKDARGSALITSDMTPNPKHDRGPTVTWDDIDPTVFIDHDRQSYLCWGNTNCYFVKLKASLTELDGPITSRLEGLPNYTEAPWLHEHNGLYYLSYAAGFPERTAYATAPKITGPWTYRGVIKELAGNCNTNHQAIIEFQGCSYFIYHNGGSPAGGSFRRSVCIEYLDYNPDGTIKPIFETSAGVSAVL